MAAGNTYKQCGCRDDDGKRLGQQCPRLRRGNGTWSTRHGRWYYQLNSHRAPTAPAAPRCARWLRHPGRRRARTRAGPRTASYRRARRHRDRHRIADAITKSVRETRQLPDPARVRKAVGGGHDPAIRPPAVGEWLEEWLAAKKNLRPGTVRGYASHIRLYYQPHIGCISIDRLRVSDVASVFEAIEELNEAITEARTSSDPRRRAEVKGRRIVGPATQQRIRATLRSAISTYMKQHQGMLPANVASLVELPAGDRPSPWSGPANASGPGNTTSTSGSPERGNAPTAGASARSTSGSPPPARPRSWCGPRPRPRSSSPGPPGTACTRCGG